MPISSAIPMRPWPWMIVASRRPRADSLVATAGAGSWSTAVTSVTVGGPPVDRGCGPSADGGGASRSLRRGGEGFLGRVLQSSGQLAVAHDQGVTAEQRRLLDVGRDHEDRGSA